MANIHNPTDPILQATTIMNMMQNIVLKQNYISSIMDPSNIVCVMEKKLFKFIVQALYVFGASNNLDMKSFCDKVKKCFGSSFEDIVHEYKIECVNLRGSGLGMGYNCTSEHILLTHLKSLEDLVYYKIVNLKSATELFLTLKPIYKNVSPIAIQPGFYKTCFADSTKNLRKLEILVLNKNNNSTLAQLIEEHPYEFIKLKNIRSSLNLIDYTSFYTIYLGRGVKDMLNYNITPNVTFVSKNSQDFSNLGKQLYNVNSIILKCDAIPFIKDKIKRMSFDFNYDENFNNENCVITGVPESLNMNEDFNVINYLLINKPPIYEIKASGLGGSSDEWQSSF